MFKPIQPKLVDKDRHFIGVVLAGYTDESDLVFVLLFKLCDRRSYCFAMRSPGCPEPQDRVLAGEILVIDLTTADRIGGEANGIAFWFVGSAS